MEMYAQYSLNMFANAWVLWISFGYPYIVAINEYEITIIM